MKKTCTPYIWQAAISGSKAYMKKLPGVKDTEVDMPTETRKSDHEEVCYNNTGHAETVKVVYDTQLITTAAAGRLLQGGGSHQCQ